MIEYRKGDVIKALKDGEIDLLVHGCNCFNTFGAGIAKQIKQEFPFAFEMDQDTEYGSYNKLGTIKWAGCVRPPDNHTMFIVNAYTQWKYAGPRWDDPDTTEAMTRYGKMFKKRFGSSHDSSVLVDYDALRLCMRKIAHDPQLMSRRIGMPKIGCGLAGGDWNIVSKIIEEELGDVAVYEL